MASDSSTKYIDRFTCLHLFIKNLEITFEISNICIWEINLRNCLLGWFFIRVKQLVFVSLGF